MSLRCFICDMSKLFFYLLCLNFSVVTYQRTNTGRGGYFSETEMIMQLGNDLFPSVLKKKKTVTHYQNDFLNLTRFINLKRLKTVLLKDILTRKRSYNKSCKAAVSPLVKDTAEFWANLHSKWSSWSDSIKRSLQMGQKIKFVVVQNTNRATHWRTEHSVFS